MYASPRFSAPRMPPCVRKEQSLGSLEPMNEACPSERTVMQLVRGELGADGLEQLLAHTDTCAHCAIVVAEAGLAVSAELGEEHELPLPSHERRAFAPGCLIASRYRIHARIGRGGMGEVYSAVDEELGERVALKTIAPTRGSDPLLVEHFKRELRLARKVSHPNVCKTLEFGRHDLEGGVSQCFFTMQFIEGVTLRRRLSEGERLELEQALGLVHDLAVGLQAIHEQNIVHRDIKPDNVMLTTEPGTGRLVPSWLDFGVARADLRESRSLGLAGTPDYAAPELLHGKVATRASDLYALGLVLHEVLVGNLPFSRVRSFAEAAERGPVEPLRPSAFRSDLPPALDELVRDCLAADPVLRPASAAQLAARLDSIRAGQSDRTGAATKQSTAAPSAAVGRKTARRRWFWGAAALALIGCLIDRLRTSQASLSPTVSSESARTSNQA